jgi:DNA polymerase-3 subunit alpha/error-prone DNA polymerase
LGQGRVEAAGLVKIDLLGNRSLAVVRDSLANLKDNGIDLDNGSWRPLEDSDTVNLLARGDTMGVFYVESPAMRLLQKKTERGDFEHLVIHSSIIRPAANRYINEYIDRLNGSRINPFTPSLGICLQRPMGSCAIRKTFLRSP